MFPTSHVRSTTTQVLATAALTKVEHILPEKPRAIGGAKATILATCAHNSPSVASVSTMVPEEHPSMTTALKHLKPHKTPPSMDMPSGSSTSPAV